MPVVKTDKNGHSLGSSPTPIPATDQAVSAINHPSRAAQDRHGTQTGLGSDREGPAAPPDERLAPVPVRHVRCGATCAFDGATDLHHGRLTSLEYDQDVLLELMEMAVTWPELEYPESHTIPPDSWMAFAESHYWADPDRVERIFSIATDIVMTARRASQRRFESSDCHFGHADDAGPTVISDAPGAQRQDAEPRQLAAALAGEACARPVIRSANDDGR